MVDTANGKDEEEEGITLLTLSHLLRRAQPLTATASLTSNSKRHPPRLQKTESAIHTSRKPRILSSVNYSAILIGTLKLPSETMRCSNKNCFQFSDDSSTVCCDILDFHPSILGKLIRILAWNFIPSKHCSGGGFVEIIKWKVECSSFSLSSCSSLDSIRLVSGTVTKEGKSKHGYCVHGLIVSVSPVSIVPCSIGDGKTQNLRGFVMEIFVCECSICNNKNRSNVNMKEFSEQGDDQHLFMKQLFVYFYGSSWFWHPAITMLIGNLVTLSGLKKKLIFVRKEESQLMFVTTENSVLHMPKSLCKKKLAFSRSVIKGEGESGFYTGVVKCVYMQGMVVELDNEVWLLWTDQLLTAPHSLRVGAIISVRNVHFVNPKFSWTKMLILGACFRTSIIVESFSPLETGCRILSQSSSQLVKFIASLTFSARLWALLVIACFRKKFAGIFVEKEILGSQHKEGLAQTFISSHFPPSVFQARHGVLSEILKHGSCGCSNEPQLCNVKLVSSEVTPLYTFLGHCQAICMRQLLMQQEYKVFHEKTAFSFQSPEGRSFGRPLRATISSEDLGVFLVGILKICPSSGRLQLVDATGSIDIIVPDLPITWRTNRICEVVKYTLVMEGGADTGDDQELLSSESMSCRDVFNYIPCSRKMNSSIYAYFNSRDIIYKTISSHPREAIDDDCEDLQRGRYHMIWVTHKYPLLQKFPGNPILSDKSVFFAEIIVLPWDIFLGGKEGTLHPTDCSGSGLCKPLEHDANEKEQNLPKKKRKTDKASALALDSSVTSDYSYDGNDLSTLSGYCSTSSSRGIENLDFNEIPCLATFRRTHRGNLFSSGRLHCTLGISPDYKQIAYRVLLEFDSENLSKYQLLQIGSYYIIKHHSEDSLCCSITGHDNLSSRKILATSKTHLWGLSLSSAEVFTVNRPPEDLSPHGSPPSNKDKLVGDQVELLHGHSSESCSDVHLTVSSSVFSLLEERLNELKELTKSNVTQKEDSTASPHTSSMMSSSSSLFPDGNLVTVIGRVEAIVDIYCNSVSVHSSCEILADVFHVGLGSGTASSLCIHVLVDNQMVSIFSSRTYVYPVGFGPGASATFHRVLKLRGTNSLMLTPVSFIVINSIRVANEPFHQKSANFWSSVHDPTATSLDDVSSGMISQLVQRTDCRPLKLNCRVVAIHSLHLEYNKQSNVPSRRSSVGIPLVGFVLDDGSSSCCCWANGERAETLLRLHEALPLRAWFEINGCTLKWVGRDKSFLKTSMYHLERILKKHKKVTVKNYGSVVDSSSQDLTVCVNSDDGLSSSDENLLKVITLNACAGKSWTVVASVLDSIASKNMEKEHLVHMEMTAMNSMPNVWAMEVCHTETLTAARNIAQELALPPPLIPSGKGSDHSSINLSSLYIDVVRRNNKVQVPNAECL